MKLKNMIKVMQHFEDGGEVEFSDDNFKTVLGKANKKDDGDLGWDWEDFAYRIIEPKQKVTIEKWLGKDKQGDYIILEASRVDKYIPYELVKLIESYEVEL